MEERVPSMDYVYLPIRDARKCVGARVNLCAAVVWTGNAKKSRGSDYVITLKIVDQSYSETFTSVNFFANDKTKLPLVRAIGDIICLHQVEMKIHGDSLYCVQNKKYSSFALFEGKIASDFSCYQISIKHRPTDHDDAFILQIRNWLLTHPPKEVKKDELLLLCSIRLNLTFDLVCKVLHVSDTSDGAWVLFVWDGTDTPSASLESDLELKGSRPFPLHFEDSPLSIEVLNTFPAVGSVLRVSTSQSFKEIPRLLGGGQWVRLLNMFCELHNGIWNGTLQSFSEIQLLSDANSIVRHRLVSYADRCATRRGIYPMAFPSPSQITGLQSDPMESLLPSGGLRLSCVFKFDTISYSSKDLKKKCFAMNPNLDGRFGLHLFRVGAHLPESSFVVLLGFLEYLNNPKMLNGLMVTHKCMSIVRLVAASPWQGKDLVSPVEGQYCAQFTLEDPTARILAFIVGEDAVNFFNGYPSSDVLMSKMNKLLGITDAAGQTRTDGFRDPPWFWCCLKSYYLDKSNQRKTRRYRLFATRLLV